MKNLNNKINLRGNREQHHALSISKNKKVLRRGVWLSNEHITLKTKCTYNFIEFY